MMESNVAQEPEKVVAGIVTAAGGRLVSRIRLQKIAYLLDQLGLQSGFRYSYHHYGPYSRDLDLAVQDAEGLGLMREDFGHRASDGARYSIFLAETAGSPEGGASIEERLRRRIGQLASVNVTVLELAATAHWLVEGERVEDWRAELVRRKGTKTAGGRLEQAVGLLCELGLPPAVRA